MSTEEGRWLEGLDERTERERMEADTPDVLTEQIAALLSKHIFTLYPDALGCDCDWSTDEGNDNQRIDAWTEHVAVVLAARVAAERERADAAPPFDTENLIAFVRTFETGEAAANALPIYLRAALGGEATP